MHTTGKWLARAGSLLVMLGFFLPSLTVSCTILPQAGQSFSLSQLAGWANQPLLYVVLLGALAMFVLCFLVSKDRQQAFQFLLGQIIGIGLSAVSILIAVLSLYAQVTRLGGFSVKPQFGSFVLLFGYGLAAAGIILQYGEGGLRLDKRHPVQASASPAFAAHHPAERERSGPILEVLRGNLALTTIPIQTGDFTIGRSSKNHLQIPDKRVSAYHARLRFAQGAWFIQDQNSSNGTYVNRQPVRASRLNSGDQITIGDTTIVIYT